MQFDSNFLNSYRYIIGCDEVGRGPLAGPVVGCAVKISYNSLNFLSTLGLNDSKKLSHRKRIEIIDALKVKFALNQRFEHEYFSFCLYEHGPADIDKMNILQASLSCMKNATLKLETRDTDIVLIDGNKTFDLPGTNIEPVVKGDSKSLAIGLASIIAKVYRDNLMIEFNKKYPGYGLDSHAGYPTKSHKEAIAKLGITPIHRKSFKGVKEFI